MIVAVVSALVTVSLALYARATLRETRRANKKVIVEARIANSLPTVSTYLRQFREMHSARSYIVDVDGLRRDFSRGVALSDLPEDVKVRVLTVCHYLDNLGVLVARQLVDPETIAGFIGDSIIALWIALAPFIKKEREKRREDYQMYFEDLAATMVAIGPAVARAGLKRFPEKQTEPH